MFDLGNQLWLDRFDAHNWVLYRSHIAKKGRRAGETVFVAIGYYSFIRDACRAAAERGCDPSAASDLRDLAKSIDRWADRIESELCRANDDLEALMQEPGRAGA